MTDTKIKASLIFIPGYVHQIESVQSQPQTVLTHWQLIKVRDNGGKFSRHLMGRAGGVGRVSTDIVSLDVVQLRATTKSGRVYVLDRPGRDGDAAWIFPQWLKANKCTQHTDQTRALMRLRDRKMSWRKVER
jgi:hypothetical protein